MSNVFISHSSHDKRFVRRLASALLAEGFPVWLDSWTLELGDSLLDRVYGGIESTSVLLLVVSQHAVESGWVNRELNAALALEEQSGRKFVIPIKLGDCALPLKIADRLYADFSSSFSLPFTTLADLLAKRECRDLGVDPERELMALSFTNEVHLDAASLTKTLEHVRRRHRAVRIAPQQIVVNEDSEYEELSRRLHARIDNIAEDPYFSPALERHLRGDLDSVRERERWLRDGVALLLSNGCSTIAVYWFARIVRGQSVYSLWAAQTPDAPDVLEYGKPWSCAQLGSDAEAREFFEAAGIEPAHLWSEGGSANPFSIWLPTESLRDLFVEELGYIGPHSFVETCGYGTADKYALPQMVLAHLKHGVSPILWKLEDAIVGIR